MNTNMLRNGTRSNQKSRRDNNPSISITGQNHKASTLGEVDSGSFVGIASTTRDMARTLLVVGCRCAGICRRKLSNSKDMIHSNLAYSPEMDLGMYELARSRPSRAS